MRDFLTGPAEPRLKLKGALRIAFAEVSPWLARVIADTWGELFSGDVLELPASPTTETERCEACGCAEQVPATGIPETWGLLHVGERTRIVCESCAERLFWPKGQPFENLCPVMKPCPHCRSQIGGWARCPCIELYDAGLGDG